MALLQRARRNGRARVRDNGLEKAAETARDFCHGGLPLELQRSCGQLFLASQHQACVGAPGCSWSCAGGLPCKIPGAYAHNRIPRCKPVLLIVHPLHLWRSGPAGGQAGGIPSAGAGAGAGARCGGTSPSQTSTSHSREPIHAYLQSRSLPAQPNRQSGLNCSPAHRQAFGSNSRDGKPLRDIQRSRPIRVVCPCSPMKGPSLHSGNVLPRA